MADAIQQHPCIVCGTTITGRKAKLCSEQCKWQNRTKLACAVCNGPTGLTRRKANQEPICRPCKKKIPGEHGSNRMYYTLKCRCDTCRAWAADRVREYVQRTGYKRPPRTKNITCVICGKQSQVQADSKAVHCSQKCVGVTNKIKQSRRAEVMLYTGPKYIRTPRINNNPIPVTKRKFKAATCKVCLKQFITLNTDVTCSYECQRRHGKEQRRLHEDRRRARKKDAYIADVWRKNVFKRDQYRCHICRKKTDPTKAVPHPKAPTIDHLVPLAQGGTHEPANCATACFMCNAVKGDRGGGEQLAMLG